MAGLIWTIIVICFIGWLLGLFAFHVTAWTIHTLIVIAVILLVFNLITGRGARV